MIVPITNYLSQSGVIPMPQPTIQTADGKRNFACSPAAVLAYIINENEQILFLSSPKRPGWWENVNGALEAGESVLDGVLRETREEAGPEIQVRPLGTLHVSTYHYDESAMFMLSLNYLLAYEGGRVIPGDDMIGSDFRWLSFEEITGGQYQLLPPSDQPWLIHRAIELYRLWRNLPEEYPPVELQRSLDRKPFNKYLLSE
jgi:8-oxo-dGTP pyrophosphatase MutT (NUDIX family)